AAWQAALARYPAVVDAQGAEGLAELDAWYREALPGLLAARRPPGLEPSELVDVVRWKMKRGEWRARNLALLKSNPDDAIRLVAERAFAAVPDPRRPVATLAELAGVGPATASAALAAYRPDLYPFPDDLVGAALPGLGRPQFSLPYYLRYAARLRERAASLGAGWTAQAVGLALWADSGGKAAREGR